MSASESDRILAPGVPLTLADGREVTLRYSTRSLKMVEDRWGSVRAFHDALNGLTPDAPGEEPSNPKLVSTIVAALSVGLIYEGVSEDDLLDGLTEFVEMWSYFGAISKALDQAFPLPGRGRGKDEAEEVATTTSSLGDGSTTPPPPASVEATNSSGA